MAKIFGFSGGEIQPLPEELEDQVESTMHLSDGESATITFGGFAQNMQTSPRDNDA